jgi:osmotically inducible protein OsmC
MKRTASAVWVGDLKNGKGVITTQSGVLSRRPYFANDNAKGRSTNPNELMAAAHAACFSMTLANELARAGFIPHRIDTTATITMEQRQVGWTIIGIQLDVLVQAPRAKQSDFIRAAICAKAGCMISRVLKTSICMSAKLENSDNRRVHHKVRHPTNSLKVSPTKKQSIGRRSRERRVSKEDDN